jgi:alpha-galactosidase
MRAWRTAAGLAAAVALAVPFASRLVRAQDAVALQQDAAPAGGLWVDSLDLGKLPSWTLRRMGGRGRGRAATPTPPPRPTYALGGATYLHGVPLNVNADLAIDLKGAAVRFEAMVGIADPVSAGRGRAGGQPAAPPRGSVTFDVWVDGRHVGDSGLVHAGDAPTLMRVDLAGAHRLILSVGDGGDGPQGDNAIWGGALITLAPGAQATPEIATLPVEPEPAIASSHTAEPRLNYPRITGATPGRPFQFLIPASGDGPLTFAATNLPAGLTLDARTGLITGSLQQAGRTVTTVTVTGPTGRATAAFTIVGGTHVLALTPPLGWNSWNVWGRKVDDAKVRAAADGMVSSGLARQGYTYVNIDDTWEGPRDASGAITTNEKFPDMTALAAYVHGKGLKIGIYSSPGPRTCAGFPATFEHEAQDAHTWAAWGFDYLKYDWCSYQGDRNSLADLQKPYILMRSVLDSLDRDVVFSLCQYGWGDVWEWGQQVGGNLWRVTGDITDTWPSMSGIGFQQTGHEKFAGPGHWNDTDMLVVGKVGWGRQDEPRPTQLTPNEQMTHISLWALQAAPLLIGADLSQLDTWTIDLLGNPEVLAVSQDVLGQAAGRLAGDGRYDVWARRLSDGTVAVGLFNRNPEAASVGVALSDLGLSGRQPVRDLWRHQDLAPVSGRFAATVPRHGVMLVRIGRPKPGVDPR